MRVTETLTGKKASNSNVIKYLFDKRKLLFFVILCISEIFAVCVVLHGFRRIYHFTLLPFTITVLCWP